jgi:hypothetical protein
VNENNPYPPSSKNEMLVVDKSLTLADYVLLTLIMMQLVLVGFYVPHLLNDMLMGMVSFVAALGFMTATLLLLPAALLVFLKSRFAVYIFAVSLVFGLLAVISFHPIHVFTGVAVASVGFVLCLMQKKPKHSATIQ